MSKFFVQLLLSVIVGVSAAWSFNPHIKAALQETLRQTNVSLHRAAEVAANGTNHVVAKLRATVSAHTQSKASTERGEKVQIRIHGSSNVKINRRNSVFSNLLSAFSLHDASAVETKTQLDSATPGMDAQIKNKTRSALNLNLGLGK